MPGERGLDRDLRRLAIADLADEDDVGILAHDGAQRGAEGQTGRSCTWTCTMPGSRYSIGILDRDDVDAARLHLAQRGVERRRLAAPGRTGDEHEPLALLEQRADAREVGVAEADRVEGAEAGAAVEDADDDLLAVRRRESRYAQIDDGAAHGDAGATVLRAHADRRCRARRGSSRARRATARGSREQARLTEHAVDAMADGDPFLFGLDVDVARARLDPLGEELIDERDRGGRIVARRARRVPGSEADVLHLHGRRGRSGALSVGVPARELRANLRRCGASTQRTRRPVAKPMARSASRSSASLVATTRVPSSSRSGMTP